MSIPFLNNINLNGNQLLSALLEVLASDPGALVEGRIWYNSTTHLIKYRDNSGAVSVMRGDTTLNNIPTATGNVALGSNKITGLATPTTGTDAANKDYVDNAIAGLNWKDSVRVASTANVSISSAPSSIDGVTLASTNRILLKDQTAGAENGIWVFNGAASALTRATDADATAEIESATVFVEEGTANANTAWTITTDSVTIGTTAQVWVQFGGGSVAPTAGAGLSLSSNTYDVNVDNSTVEINADTLRVKAAGITANELAVSSVDLATTDVTGTLAIAKGGTASTTAAAARTALGTASVFAADITGDGTTTAFAVTHSLGTKDVLVQIWEATTDQEVIVDIVRTSTSVVTVTFAVAPVNAKVYRAVIFAKA